MYEVPLNAEPFLLIVLIILFIRLHYYYLPTGRQVKLFLRQSIPILRDSVHRSVFRASVVERSETPMNIGALFYSSNTIRQ